MQTPTHPIAIAAVLCALAGCPGWCPGQVLPLGVNVATMPFTEDFEALEGLRPYWAITGTNDYRTRVTTSYYPHGGAHLNSAKRFGNGYVEIAAANVRCARMSTAP